MDIFDLVSGMQEEEKLEKQKRREIRDRKRLKERHKGGERGEEVDGEKERDGEVSWRKSGDEFPANIVRTPLEHC